jgi:phage FluMu protein Com
VIVLSQTYPGLTLICEGCGALLAYKPADIYGNLVYCPLCKRANEINMDKSYDGIIKEEKKNDVLES